MEQCTLCGEQSCKTVLDNLDNEILKKYFPENFPKLCTFAPYCVTCAKFISRIREADSHSKATEGKLLALRDGFQSAIGLRTQGCTISPDAAELNNFNRRSNPGSSCTDEVTVVKSEDAATFETGVSNALLGLWPVFIVNNNNQPCTIIQQRLPEYAEEEGLAEPTNFEPNSNSAEQVEEEGALFVGKEEVISDFEAEVSDNDESSNARRLKLIEPDSKPSLHLRDMKTCEICNLKFKFAISFESHYHKKDGTVGFKCINKNCLKEFGTRGGIAAHFRVCKNIPRRIEVKVKSISCYFCGKKEPYFWKMDRHMQMHTSEKRHKCVNCKALFAAQTGLDYHIEVFHNTKGEKIRKLVRLQDYELLKCKTCKQEFRSKTVFQSHIHKNDGSIAYKCPNGNCSKEFQKGGVLVTHFMICKNIPSCKLSEKEKRTCYFCGMQHKGTNPLLHHMRSHTWERPYICRLVGCGKELHCQSSLNRHVKLCHGPREGFQEWRLQVKVDREKERQRLKKCPPKCYFCDRKFSNFTYMAAHMRRIHTLERPAIICKECGKSFSIPERLRHHQIQFHGTDEELKMKLIERRREMQKKTLGKNAAHLVCYFCKRQLQNKNFLTNHVSIHTKERASHTCSACMKKLRSGKALEEHMKQCNGKLRI